MSQGTGWMTTLADYQNYSLPWEEFRKVTFREFAEQLVDGEFREILTNSPNRGAFEQKFRLYGLGMQVLETRYAFFSKLLHGDPALLKLHQDEIGTGDLEKRLLFALHYLFVRGARVLRTYNDMLGNYPEYIKKLQAMVDKPGNDCRAIQVCICKGGIEPFTSSCLALDNSILLPFRPKSGPKLATQADIDKLFG
jgi:hypothetical protein